MSPRPGRFTAQSTTRSGPAAAAEASQASAATMALLACKLHFLPDLTVDACVDFVLAQWRPRRMQAKPTA